MFTTKRNTNSFPPAKPNGDTNRDLIDIEIALAREYIAEIVSRSNRFQDALTKIQSKEKKNANRKMSKHLQEAARWRKENRILGNDIRMLLDQVAKKRRQIERNEARIQELMTSIEENKEAASAPVPAEEPEDDPRDEEWFEDNFCMCL